MTFTDDLARRLRIMGIMVTDTFIRATLVRASHLAASADAFDLAHPTQAISLGGMPERPEGDPGGFAPKSSRREDRLSRMSGGYGICHRNKNVEAGPGRARRLPSGAEWGW